MTHNPRKDARHPKSRPELDSETQPSSSTRSAVVRIVREGRDLFKANRFQDALDKFSEALALEEHNVYALVGSADACRRGMRFDEAKVYYEKALLREPSNPFALVGLGDTYRGMSQHQKSIEVWTRYLALQPDNVQVLTRIGDAYRRTGQFELAIKAYSDALFHDPANPYALRGRADSYRGLGQYEQAIGSWEAYDLYHPDNPAILSRLGDSRLRLNDLDSAEASFKKSLEADGKHIYAFIGLGETARRRGRLVDAASFLAEAMSIDPQNPRLLTAMTTLLLEPKPPRVEDKWVLHLVRMALRENRSEEASALVRNLPEDVRKRIASNLAAEKQ